MLKKCLDLFVILQIKFFKNYSDLNNESMIKKVINDLFKFRK